jgi:5-methylcytosine-specific restriction endonuclease McrA
VSTQVSSVLPKVYSSHPEAVESRNRREYLRKYQAKWITKRRQDWIAQNGPCAVCGSDDRLEVDHVHPEEKEIQVRALWSMSPQNPRRIAELAKCQVLCYVCHKEKTRPLLAAKALRESATRSRDALGRWGSAPQISNFAAPGFSLAGQAIRGQEGLV